MGRTTDLILSLKLKQVAYSTVPASMSVYQGCVRLVKMSLWNMPHGGIASKEQTNKPSRFSYQIGYKVSCTPFRHSICVLVQ